VESPQKREISISLFGFWWIEVVGLCVRIAREPPKVKITRSHYIPKSFVLGSIFLRT
jgi:hypothetical protein